MNKKILYTAIISIFLQCFYTTVIRSKLFSQSFSINIFILQIIFYAIAIPYSSYQLYKTYYTESKKRITNIIGVFFTLPLLFIVMLVSIYFEKHEPTAIDPNDIHIYNNEGSEIEIDSLLKDTANISRIHINEE